MRYMMYMRKPTDINVARASIRLARENLDSALATYIEAIAKFRELLDEEFASLDEQPIAGATGRLPKGQVQSLVKVVFSGPGTGRLRFRQVQTRTEALAGFQLSTATLRQTLYRMEAAGELERYGSFWSVGGKLLR